MRHGAKDRQLSRTELSHADRRLTTQLAYGVLREPPSPFFNHQTIDLS